MTGSVYRALGVAFTVEGPPRVQRMFAELFGDLLDPSATPNSSLEFSREGFPRRWCVRFAGETLLYGAALGESLADGLVGINKAAATSRAPIDVVLHAGTLQIGESAVAIAGPSGAGKSTLVAAGVLAGHGFISDEVTAVHPATLAVEPYHRPIGLRAGGAEALGIRVPRGGLQRMFEEAYPWRVSGRGRLSSGAPLGMVAVVSRQQGPAHGRILRPAEALATLTNITIGAHDHELALFRRLEQLVRTVPVVELHYDHATDGLAKLLELNEP